MNTTIAHVILSEYRAFSGSHYVLYRAEEHRTLGQHICRTGEHRNGLACVYWTGNSSIYRCEPTCSMLSSSAFWAMTNLNQTFLSSDIVCNKCINSGMVSLHEDQSQKYDYVFFGYLSPLFGYLATAPEYVFYMPLALVCYYFSNQHQNTCTCYNKY